MSCKQCSYVINGNYKIAGKYMCHYCSTSVDCSGMNVIGTYKGKQGIVHLYRIHPVLLCPECESELYIVDILCENDSPVVFAEYDEFFNINQSHWIGR
jgi:hypothetical protein